MDKSDTQWRYLTADDVVAIGECELLYAYLVVSGASTDSAIYDGTGTGGKKIADLKSAVVTGHEFKPPRPIRCQVGIYVDVGTSVSGIFVQYRMV